MAEAVEERARAKINLGLRVLRRRADGYHDLDSVVVFADLADRLTFSAHDVLTLALDGPFGAALERERDNLALRAARRLGAEAGRTPDVLIRLEKHIPVAAGLGGGSADAAAVLRGLNRFWHLGLGADDLEPLALELGADVPVCLASRPARMRGIGEQLDPLGDLPELPLLLVNPCVAVPTAAVFRGLGLAPDDRRPEGPAFDAGSVLGWLRASANDLEAPAKVLVPVIGDVLDLLEAQGGCRLARMSGSGATCFGLFADPETLATAEAELRALRPAWWIVATTAGGATAASGANTAGGATTAGGPA